MRELPSGTLTFLFTDIEGSTRLWEQYPERMRQAHARHGELAVSCVEQHGGTFVRTRGEGDSTFSVFPVTADAVVAACALQRALAAEPWPAEAPIRVRAALHTGTANLSDEDYNSSDVNRCARLRAIAHGGQTVLSQTVYDLIQERLPAEISFKDMGLHRLKDLQQPEHVWQLCHPDLPIDFPPLNSLNPITTNLPIQTTSFIGREKEIQDIKQRLTRHRMLTLTGSGGCGKTRLSLQVGAEVVDEYPDGVWLVELAAISDASLVPQEVAAVLRLREEAGRALTQTITEYLVSRRLLLILDNCEHLLDACARLADTLLRHCPQVQILATSREPLNISGEQPWRVPSLLAPDPKKLPAEEKDMAAVLMDFDACRLFVERAREQRQEFALVRTNAPVVARLCRRLDGIPLALELAAARVRALPVEQIEDRLQDRFRLLTSGRRTALPRQQTLRALIDWSYDLLSPTEQTLFARCSVFAGGWTLGACEQVCADGEVEEWEILDLLTALVDKSLVVYEEHNMAARYRLLETVRQYAQEKLGPAEQAERIRARHRDYYLVVAEGAKEKLRGPEQALGLEILETEHDNCRAAMDFCRMDADGGLSGLRLAAALMPFWNMRGYLPEGRAYLQEALAHLGAQETSVPRAAALNGAGALSWMQGDYAAALAFFSQSLALFRALNDPRSIAFTLNSLCALTQNQGDYPAARAYGSESLALRLELGDQPGAASTLNNLGNIARAEGDYAAAHTRYSEALTLFRELRDPRNSALSLMNLGVMAEEQGDYAAARSYLNESLAIQRDLGDKWGVAYSLINLSGVCQDLGEYTTARSCLQESLSLQRELGDKRGLAYSLESFAALARRQAQPQRAVGLYAAADSLRQVIGCPLTPNERQRADDDLAALRSSLSEAAFTTADAHGRAISLDAAIEFAVMAPLD